jgi:hypothetical protein
MRAVGVAGHPEGHPAIDNETLDQSLRDKRNAATRAGLRLFVVTQFCFEAAPILGWLAHMTRQSALHPAIDTIFLGGAGSFSAGHCDGEPFEGAGREARAGRLRGSFRPFMAREPSIPDLRRGSLSGPRRRTFDP